MALTAAFVSLALVPLRPRGTRCHGVVVPLEPQLLLTEDVRLEALPSLQLEVVERTAMCAKPVRHTGRKIHERAGVEFLRIIPDLNQPTALEYDVAVGGALRVGARADVPMIGRRSARMVAHLARLNGIGRREPAAIEEPYGGLGAEATYAAATGVTERAERPAIEEISRPAG